MELNFEPIRRMTQAAALIFLGTLALSGCSPKTQERVEFHPAEVRVAAQTPAPPAEESQGEPVRPLKLAPPPRPRPRPRPKRPAPAGKQPIAATLAVPVPQAPVRPSAAAPPAYPVVHPRPSVPVALPGPSVPVATQPVPAAPAVPVGQPTGPDWQPPSFRVPGPGYLIQSGSGTANIYVGPGGQSLKPVLKTLASNGWVNQCLLTTFEQVQWSQQFAGQVCEFQYQYVQVTATGELLITILDRRVVNGEAYRPD